MNIFKSIRILVLLVLFAMLKIQPVLAQDYLILAFGDSLTAGYGLAPQQGFPRQLEQALIQKGHKARVINSGVSGETSSGGLSRLEWVLLGMKPVRPDLVIIELGANDALRGISPDITRNNIDGMLAVLAKEKIPTLVAGMIAPPNMGPEYSGDFNRIFPELSAKYRNDLYPFFLDGVAGNSSLNQSDAIHPNAEGVAIIVRKIMPYVLSALELFKKK